MHIADVLAGVGASAQVAAIARQAETLVRSITSANLQARTLAQIAEILARTEHRQQAVALPGRPGQADTSCRPA